MEDAQSLGWLRSLIDKLFEAFLSQYGPTFAFLLLVIVFFVWRYEAAHRKIVERQDAEIKRLVDERNWYQSQIMRSRVSSTSADDEKKGGRIEHEDYNDESR